MRSFLLISLIAVISICTVKCTRREDQDAKWISEDDIDSRTLEMILKSGKVPMKVERGKRFFFGPGIFLLFILFLLPLMCGGCGLGGGMPCGPGGGMPYGPGAGMPCGPGAGMPY
ncbi:hypothetical protein ACOME3_002674 [Neoechinorhynchus agilis]